MSFNVGVGLSQSKDIQQALQEAYRESLQRMGALKAQFVMISYTYDHGLDPELLSSILKRQFRDIPHIGWSTWSAWTADNQFEAESGVIVTSFSGLPEGRRLFKVFSIKEKQDLWASELLRHLDTCDEIDRQDSSLLVIADSIHFKSDAGFSRFQEEHPRLKVMGFGASYGIPQCSLIVDGEIYSNALLAFYLPGIQPWSALIQNICPEADKININRMSENLVIEIDEKPAFYRLTEHLMTEDDLPMMAPDEFRKHMGNMFIVEKDAESSSVLKNIGEGYRVVSLLGSEMTTGMVAVAENLDFSKQHFLGQKKNKYIEDQGLEMLEQLKTKVPKPKFIMMFCSTSHFRDKDRTKSDIQLVKSVFPQTPIFGMGTQAEYLAEKNIQSALIIAFE